jgi:hypothetical protein
MNENVLPGRALDEPVTLSPVEPLYCTLLSHKKLLSPVLCNLTFSSSAKLVLLCYPSKDPKAQLDGSFVMLEKSRQKKLQVSVVAETTATKLWSNRDGASFDCRTRTFNPNLAAQTAGGEHQIIFRNAVYGKERNSRVNRFSTRV